MLRFKSARQIKEIRDEMSEKAAKEMYEHALKLESDCRQYISGELYRRSVSWDWWVQMSSNSLV